MIMITLLATPVDVIIYNFVMAIAGNYQFWVENQKSFNCDLK